ncbi:pilus assembly protein [Rhodoblastus sp. 17X3]|uniref:TadE/TadG family type IV pilus assembly protein n=1 Tax=Rhodoblastus sp. 17X3 TaxID=3047026 RepID=UPI0024B72F13|nr:TadE/TadG family type IV pilus assembly protein [Rhodoblastus sp. 17X3]MDI9849082.1 pilus assembly protein [Rhodoblastus sp. 17X3]
MKSRAIIVDQRGATAVEFALTLPIFTAAVFGAIQIGLLLWTQLGMQNGVEAAARCASVNAILCPNAASVQNYAAQHALGLNLPASTFSAAKPGCGNQVSASYTYPLISNNFPATSLTLRAQSCFPI